MVWTAPTFNADGTVKTPAHVTAFHNGVLVQNNFELKGETLYIGKPVYKKYDTRADQAAGARRSEPADQLPQHLGARAAVGASRRWPRGRNPRTPDRPPPGPGASSDAPGALPVSRAPCAGRGLSPSGYSSSRPRRTPGPVTIATSRNEPLTLPLPLLVLLAVLTSAPTQGPTVVITGRVVTGTPPHAVSGATISAGALRVATDADGQFTLPVAGPVASVHLVVTAPGFLDQAADVAITAGRGAVEILLRPNDAISGGCDRLRNARQRDRRAADAAAHARGHPRRGGRGGQRVPRAADASRRVGDRRIRQPPQRCAAAGPTRT